MSRLPAVALAGAVVVIVFAVAVPEGAAVQPPTQLAANTVVTHDEQVSLARWTSPADWRSGSADGVRVLPGRHTGVVMSRPAGLRSYTDPHTGTTATWAYSTWTAPITSAGFGASELVASWNATTPAGTWISVELQGTYSDGQTTPWYTMGHWPFNTAYAASLGGLDAFVTRLHSLADVERLVAAGIPVVTSQSFRADELSGAGYGTSGHLFVVIGFTETGDVIVNDPASSSNDAVRRVYQREQFERIWLRTRRPLADGGVGTGSGGIAYIIHPQHLPLPPLR